MNGSSYMLLLTLSLFYQNMEQLHAVKVIQKIARGSNTCSRLSIPSARIQTKNWRLNQAWYHDGKHNECELYQRKTIENITNLICAKSTKRLNIQNKLLIDKKRPMKEIDGFEWTEDFDGYIHHMGNDFYFNLKIICDAGGSQTRSLREVYHFITTQLDHLVAFTFSNVYFVNILDGNTCANSMDKYNYLINKPQYGFIRNRVFVGDMKEFQNWWIANYKK
jgi:hypothetical protein